ncbi:MAG TPA: AI-2E family transporter [Candidatus Saccharimonadales bacterium]|jgi:predicted PurR-regulated permease PerM|nr:AI-2E family transporter [Candidatus Saccharimonadales bacterium]
MKTRIEIDTRTFVRFWLVVIGFAAVILAIFMARTALITIGISLFLALALNPPVSKIASLLPGRSRIGATAIAYLVVISLLGGFLFLVVPPVIEQSTKLAQAVPGFIDEISNKRGVVDDFVHRYNLDSEVNQAIDNAKNQASGIASNLGNSLVSGVSSFFNGAITLLFVLVLTFFMLVEGPMWMERIWGLYNDEKRLLRHRSVVSKMYRVVTGYVNGQVLVAAIAGTCALVTFLILSYFFHFAPNLALPLAAIVFLCGMVPLIGATVGGIIVLTILAFNDVSAAIVYLIYFIVYQQIENNFISPTIQAKKVELSAVAILSAIFIGITVAGLLGAIVAIPIAGCLRVLLVDYLAYAKEEREHHDKTGRMHRLVSKLK